MLNSGVRSHQLSFRTQKFEINVMAFEKLIPVNIRILCRAQLLCYRMWIENTLCGQKIPCVERKHLCGKKIPCVERKCDNIT